MFCPNCSEPKPVDATQFCKRCGLDLFGLSEFIESGESSTVKSFDRRLKGVRQGSILFGIGLILIPVWMFIGAAFPPNDRMVESAPSTTVAEMLAWIGMWMSLIAGAIRIGYAFLFEGRQTFGSGLERSRAAKQKEPGALPSADYFRPADPGSWKTSGELFEKVKVRHSGEL
jgi:hypothetical protein